MADRWKGIAVVDRPFTVVDDRPITLVDDRPITSVDQLPLVLDAQDFQRLLKVSSATFKRMKRAGALPAPLIEGDRHAQNKTNGFHDRWSRDVAITWLNGGSARRGRRR